MTHNKLCTVTVCLLVLLAFGASAQKPAKKAPAVKKTAVQKPVTNKPAAEKPKPTSPDVAVDASGDEKKVRDIVAFLEFVLNTLGSSTTSRDKDDLVTTTYY